MLVFLSEVLAFLIADVAWWWLADRRLRTFAPPSRGGVRALASAQPRILLARSTTWRILLAAFTACQIAYMLLYTTVSLIETLHEHGPLLWRVEAYLWHIIVLPLTLGALLLFEAVRWVKRILSPPGIRERIHRTRIGIVSRLRFRASDSAKPQAEIDAAGISTVPIPEPAPHPAARLVTRRDALAAAGIAVPMLATAALTVQSLHSLGDFRIRRATLRIPTLPADLDGLTILQLSDLHVGRFLPADLIQRTADAANSLPADLVVFTGDLYDVSARDIAPGIDFIHRLDPRHGLVMIAGNHDGMANADWFEVPMRAADMPLLIDQTRVFRVPGRSTPIQMLGMAWGELLHGSDLGRIGRDRNRHFRVRSAKATDASLRLLLSQRNHDAFPILLAHHPHDFDPAAAAGLPLVLSGHTHGGQIMLNEQVGVGPARFRYWTGPYAKGVSRLFVSNGLGSWFPLRVNAPAEITHLTLERG